MQTPKTYITKLNNGIITDEMLALCLYSVNKRAKNYRDKAKSYYYYVDRLEAEEKKEHFYKQKEILLSILEPEAIHIEKKTGHYRELIDGDYDNYPRGYYFTEDDYYTVSYEEYNLFAVYVIQGYSFHSPIAFSVPEEYLEKYLEPYKDLPRDDLNDFMTQGRDINELLSCQFVDKVVKLIKNGDYQRQ